MADLAICITNHGADLAVLSLAGRAVYVERQAGRLVVWTLAGGRRVLGIVETAQDAAGLAVPALEEWAGVSLRGAA